jgi:hypothetical protein
VQVEAWVASAAVLSLKNSRTDADFPAAAARAGTAGEVIGDESGRIGPLKFSRPRGRELVVDHLPSIQDARRLQYDHFGLFVGTSAMLDTAGHYDKLAGRPIGSHHPAKRRPELK